MTNKYLATAFFVVFQLFMSVDSAWAVQSHGGSEGLVAHQLGHLLFTIGMGYLLFRLRTMQQKGRGWVEFKVFIWLLVIWNILTFTGHWMNEFVAAEKFIRTNGNISAFAVENFSDAIYYLTRLDHLALVPAFACLLLALRKWSVSQ